MADGTIEGVVEIDGTPVQRELIAISYEKQGDPPARVVVGEASSAVDGTYTLTTPGFIDEVIVLALDHYGEVWRPNQEYTFGQRIRPTKGNETGYGYDITVAGNSGATEPAWWVPAGGSTQGQIGTATAEAAPLWWSVAHAPILPEPSEPPPEPLTPIDIAAMLWLHGKDAATITEVLGKISAWADKSGNGYNVEQASDSLRPTYDPSDGGILFSTGSMALSGTIPGAVASGDFVIGIAMDYQSDGGWGSYISFLQIATGGLDGVFWHYSKSTAQLVQFYSDGGTAVSGPMANNALGPMILTLEKVGDDYALYRDGVQLATGTKASPNLTADQSLIVGKGTFSNAKSMTGKYYEIVIAPGERQKVEGMLAWENQLETLLPFDHPYVDGRPMTGA